MAHEHPEELDKEVTLKLAQNWGNDVGPQKVEGKPIEKDLYLAQYKVISHVLGDKDAVLEALRVFEGHLYEQVPLTYRYAWKRLRSTNEQVIGEVASYVKTRSKATKKDERDPALRKLFSNALLAAESKAGFSRFGDVVTLSGGIDGEIFQKDLVGQGRRWKDVGVPGNHGEHTHRLQWYVIAYHFKFAGGLTDVYRHIGHWVWSRNGVPKYLALWDALFDRHPTDNPFPPNDALDFRSPENLCNWIIKAENEDNFPLLHAYLKARFEKRRDPTFSIKDYLAGKLYGMDIGGLQAEFERTGDKTKLEKIAAETDSPADLGAGPRARKEVALYKVSPGKKIHERSEFVRHG